MTLGARNRANIGPTGMVRRDGPGSGSPKPSRLPGGGSELEQVKRAANPRAAQDLPLCS